MLENARSTDVARAAAAPAAATADVSAADDSSAASVLSMMDVDAPTPCTARCDERSSVDTRTRQLMNSTYDMREPQPERPRVSADCTTWTSFCTGSHVNARHAYTLHRNFAQAAYRMEPVASQYYSSEADTAGRSINQGDVPRGFGPRPYR
jgi:hypothetical protein